MSQTKIADKLLMLLASGESLERVVADLPMFKTQIESAFEWMKAKGQYSATEVTEQAMRLRELVSQKDQAIKQQDFYLAAERRADEVAIYESFGLSADAGSTVLYTGVEEQMRELSELLRGTWAG